MNKKIAHKFEEIAQTFDKRGKTKTAQTIREAIKESCSCGCGGNCECGSDCECGCNNEERN
jgi:hypothetical protein